MEDHYTKHLLFFMLLCFILGSFSFIIGFFPASYDVVNHLNEKMSFSRPTILGDFLLYPPERKYKQTILIIVDALRYDFTSFEEMPYSYNTSCNRIKLLVDIPTVTMPRIKSITTGTVSNFMDIVLNLGHAEQLDNSILHNLVKRGDKIVFAGDQTWVNLFPTEFHRQFPNTDSFFVGDFYEGDKSVSNILKLESKRLDWSFLIGHYLGLDHIGHVEGTASVKLPAKLKEMDDVIREMNISNRLLILTGDHGMRNGGGHGGSTEEELYVPLLIFHPNCRKRTLKSEQRQIDIAPTLSILFSIEIPHASIGCIISEFIDDFSMEDQLYSYYYNTFHLLKKLEKNFDSKTMGQTNQYKWFKIARTAHIQFLRSLRIFKTKSAYFFEEAKRNYIRASSHFSSQLAESRVNFEIDLITIGLLTTTLITIYLVLYMILSDYKQLTLTNKKIMSLICFFATLIAISGFYTNYIRIHNFAICFILMLLIGASIYLLLEMKNQIFHYMKYSRRYKSSDFHIPIPLSAGIIFYLLSLTATSYIEEEHQTWYYLGPTYIIVLYSINLRRTMYKIDSLSIKILFQNLNFIKPFTILAILVVLRRINQTGNRWRHLEDIGDILRMTNNKLYLSLFFSLGLFCLFLQTIRQVNSLVSRIAFMVCILCIYSFRGLSNDVRLIAIPLLDVNYVLCAFWICILTGILCECRNIKLKKWKLSCNENTCTNVNNEFSNVYRLWFQLILALLLKPHNVILLPIMNFMQQAVYNLCDELFEHNETTWLAYKTILTFFFAKMFYFYQGNSNSLATVDLTPGFIGQKNFNAGVAVPFIAINTYCASLNGFSYFINHMQMKPVDFPEKTTHLLSKVFILYTLITLLPVACYFWYILIFRYHLFIYSVFAPKVFYDCFSVIVYFFLYFLMNFKM